MAKHARATRGGDDTGEEPRQGRRPMWKGAVSFGLVTVPVALHAATERKNELAFRLLHGKDQSPIDYKRFCEEEGVEVPWREIVKGYEIAKGRYVVVNDEDFERVRVRATQTFEIRDFVPGASIEDFYFEHPYYVVPAGRAAVKPYALLRDALAKSQRVGVGTIVLRQREHVGALEPVGDALVLTTLRWSHEIRSSAGLDLPARTSTRDHRELELALRLVETLAHDWDPTRYKDTYRDALLEVIRSKAAGKPVRAASAERAPAKVTSLVKALEASLRKAPAKGRGRRTERAA